MPIDAGKVVATLELETGAFSGGVKTARGLITSLGNDSLSGKDKILALGTAAQSLGKTLTTALTLPIIAVGTAATTTFMSFDDSIRQVRATMGLYDETNAAVAADIELITDTAKEMGATTRYSASEAAQALNYLALAGYDAQRATETLPTVLRLAQAGGIGLGEAAQMVTGSMNALGIETDRVGEFVDQMAVASQKSATTVSELGMAITVVGATAAKLAGGTVELSTELGILADANIKGAEGGTHLRNVILALTQPTESGAAALAKYTRGVYDAEGNMRSLDDILGELQQSMEGMTQAEKDSVLNDIFNKTDLSAAQILIAGAGERFAELSGYIRESQGAAEGMAEVMEGGIGGAFRNLRSATEGLAIAFGEELAPMVQGAADFVTGLVRAFTELDEGTRHTIVTIAGIAATVGPALLIIGKLTTAIASINPVVAAVTLGVGGLIALITRLNSLGGSWQKSLSGRLGLTVDESELENYKIPTESIEGGTVTANVVIKIHNTAKSAMEQIQDILTDGVSEDDEDYDTMCQGVYDIIDGVESSIKTYWDERRATLQGLFDAGLISKEDFDARMAEYDKAQADMESGLTTNAEAVTAYIATLVEANRAPTEAELEYLQQLIDKLAGVATEAAEATAAVERGYSVAYQRVVNGSAVEGDAEKGAQYIEMVAAQKRAAAQATAEQAEQAFGADLEMYQSQMDAAAETMAASTEGTEEYAAAQEQYNEANAKFTETLALSGQVQSELTAQMDAIEQERQAMYQEMAQGAAQGVQDAEALEEKLQKLADISARLDELYGENGSDTTSYPDLRGANDAERWLASFDRGGEEYLAKIDEIQNLREDYAALAEEVNGIVGPGLDTWREVMSYGAANGAFETKDITTPRGALDALAETYGITGRSGMNLSAEDMAAIDQSLGSTAQSADGATEAVTRTAAAFEELDGAVSEETAALEAAGTERENLAQDNEKATIAAREAEEAQRAAAQAAVDASDAETMAAGDNEAALEAAREAAEGMNDEVTAAAEEAAAEMETFSTTISGIPVEVDAATGEIVSICGQAVQGVGDIAAITERTINDMPSMITIYSSYFAAGQSNGAGYVAGWNAAMAGLTMPTPPAGGSLGYTPGAGSSGGGAGGATNRGAGGRVINLTFNTSGFSPRELADAAVGQINARNSGRGLP